MNIGIIRIHRRVSEARQRSTLLKWGADPDRIWVFGKEGKGLQTLKKFLKARVAREGDKIGICRLALLIDPGHGTHDKMAADVKALLKTGATLCELDTGLTWDDKGDLVQMVTDAIKQISTGRVGENGPGAPTKYVLSKEQIAFICAVWSSKDYKNDAQRQAAIREFPGLENILASYVRRVVLPAKKQQ